VVPLTSQRVDTLFPGESAVDATSTGHVPSKALATQLRTVAKERVRRLLGALTHAERDALDAAIRTHLAL
jgi:mRNA-degrading endonuclease toxin of MazEF toxin-antitoxin module